MSTDLQTGNSDKREDVRIASHEHFDLAVVDEYGQPMEVLRDAQVVNVSAGGMELVNLQPIKSQTWLSLEHDKNTLVPTRGKMIFEVVASTMTGDEQYHIHCRLIEGKIPAKMMLGW